jgi:hypothetical protein
VEFPPCTPFTDQVTEVLVVPVTVAENCCVFPVCRELEVGEIETATVGGGAMIETPALAVLVESAALLAVTVTEPPEGTDTGAVYIPLVEIVPTVELPP